MKVYQIKRGWSAWRAGAESGILCTGATMAQAFLHYFSGTGNTFRAVSITARILEKAGYQTRLIDIAAEKPAQIDGLNIFLFPTYGFTTPQVMQDYLRSLPEPGPQARAAILATIGTFSADAHGFEGNSLSTAARLLEKKGWHVFFTEAFSYPANWTQFSNPPSAAHSEEIYAVADAAVAAAAEKIAAGECHFRPLSRAVELYTRSANLFFIWLGRPMLAKVFTADSDCNSCGKCAAGCPVKAIEMRKGRPLWSYRCQVCQRCINSCPQNAIQTSIWRIAGMINLIFLPYIGWYRQLTGHMPGWPVKIVVFCAGYALCFWAFDKALAFLETTPGASALTGLSFSKSFRRYLALIDKGLQ